MNTFPKCALQGIERLDLEPIKYSLVAREEGPRWTEKMADNVEVWYKRFLYLNLVFPDKSIVPSNSIDTFWHYHILDTRKYHADCMRIFGYYLHHFPYFGARGPEDRRDLERAFADTNALYLQLFGEAPNRLGALANETADTDAPVCSDCSDCSRGDESSNMPILVEQQLRPTLRNLQSP